jgi:hypothetical protein
MVLEKRYFCKLDVLKNIVVYSRLASYSQHDSDTTFFTPNFKAKTECIPLYVPESSSTYKTTNSKVNSVTSIYYIESYSRPRGLSSGKGL